MFDIKINYDNRKFVKYDENLFQVYVLDYGDNYHRDENEPSSEFEREVRKIKARYRDINKYYYAVSLYNEYMAYLEEKYGGHELFKLKKKNGLIDEFIPPKPRIKNTKDLKFLKKNKIVISSVGRFLIDEDKLDEVIDMYSKDININDITVEKIRDKDAEKILDESSKTVKGKYKHLKSQSFKDDMDFMDSYFRNKNFFSKKKSKKSKKKNNKKNKKDRLMISDLMREDYEDHFYDENTYMEDSDQAPMMLYNNLLLSSGATKEIDVYHKLNDLGWNSYKLMKKGNYGSRVTNMFKPPKKKKKGKKNKDKFHNYDGLLVDIMSDNGFDVDDMDSFEDFQKEMLNMTSESVFR